MSRELPPLHLLRTFDVAASRLSFKAAAEALHVTPSAVSHQMRQLEELLGLALFQRANRGLRLTPAGQAYHARVHQSLQQLALATRELDQRFGKPQLRASILPLMAAEIIIPALESFHAAHPDMALRIETSVQMADFDTGEVDVAVRYGDGHWPGLSCERICDVVGSPVCSPEYARQKQLSSIEDIRHCNLIGLPLETRAWQILAQQAGMNDFEPEHTLFLDSLLAASRAAEQGIGIGIGVFPLMTPLVESRRLVTPFDIWVPVPEGYYLVWRPEDESRPDLRAFRGWIRALFAELTLPHLDR